MWKINWWRHFHWNGKNVLNKLSIGPIVRKKMLNANKQMKNGEMEVEQSKTKGKMVE